MFADEVLNEVVLAIAGMCAIRDVAGPPLEVSMALVLVADPVGFAFEGFGFSAVEKGTCERVDIFMDVFGPIRGLCKLFDLEADGTFEFRRQSGNGRLRDSWGELRRGYFTFSRGVVSNCLVG